MSEEKLSFTSRKALCVQLGDPAGREVAELLNGLIERIAHLERNKVDGTPIIPLARPLSVQPEHWAA